LGADHAGFPIKETIRQFLQNAGYLVDDLGTWSEESVDYPDYGKAVGEMRLRESDSRGSADRVRRKIPFHRIKLLLLTSNATMESKYGYSVAGDSSLSICNSLAVTNYARAEGEDSNLSKSDGINCGSLMISVARQWRSGL
jgi:hypothetical protein